jgi:hypothetical protein
MTMDEIELFASASGDLPKMDTLARRRLRFEPDLRGRGALQEQHGAAEI